MCKDYKEFNLSECSNKYAEALVSSRFLADVPKDISVSDYLFRFSKDITFCKFLEAQFERWFNSRLEVLVKEKKVSLDMALKFININSICEYTTEMLVRQVKIDSGVLEEDMVEFLIEEISSSSDFLDVGGDK